MPPLDVVLVEPYHGGSHAAWAEGLAAHSRHRVHLVTHPGRHWAWRMQGGALTLARAVERVTAGLAAEGRRPDVLLASDMVHLPALLGLARRALAGVPVVLYLHETQLTFPLSERTAAGGGAGADLTYAMTNWLSMAAADRVVFNSEHHRRAWFAAVPGFLARFPDERHTALVAEVEARSTVLPVGVDVGRFAPVARDAAPLADRRADRRADGRPTVLWNHRWEHDKDPDAFADAVEAVAARGVDFRLILAGQQFQAVPEALTRLRHGPLAERIIHDGTAPGDTYPALLAQADVAVSTARHEFFGVAVVEAVAAGALPLLPHRLAYPELVPGPDPYLYGSPAELVDRLVWALTDRDGRRRSADAARHHVQRFGWSVVAPRYDDLLNAVAAA